MKQIYTIKEIADATGTDKQKVYRYIKKNKIASINVSETFQKTYHEAFQKHIKKNTCYYDESTLKAYKHYISSESIEIEEIEITSKNASKSHHETFQKTYHETIQNEMIINDLLEQLKEKDKQIERIQKSLDNALMVLAMKEQNQAIETQKEADTSDLNAPDENITANKISLLERLKNAFKSK